MVNFGGVSSRGLITTDNTQDARRGYKCAYIAFSWLNSYNCPLWILKTSHTGTIQPLEGYFALFRRYKPIAL